MSRGRQSAEQKSSYDNHHDDADDDVSIRDLDNYLEMLYEVSGASKNQAESQTQIKGTQKILSLCRTVPNLEQLIQNNTVMGALTRVLQEEYKKSVDVTFNILRIFLAFSNFSEMHTLMGEYRMGALTMKTIEYEMRSIEVQNDEAKDRETSYNKQLRQLKSCAAKDKMSAEEEEELKTAITKLKKEKKREMEKLLRKKRKHEKVLFVSFYTLLNLSENLSVERKMTKKSLLTDLMALLDPAPPVAVPPSSSINDSAQNIVSSSVSSPLLITLADLLLVSCSFLRKLSVYSENKDVIRSSGLVGRLMPYLPCSHPPVVNSILRLLFNLSFDMEIREQMIRGGSAPYLVSLLSTPSYRSRAIRVLYHLSADDRCKLVFAQPVETTATAATNGTASVTNTTGVAILMGIVVNFPQPMLPPELAALAVNVSLHPACAELMTANKGLNYLMDRLVTPPTPAKSTAAKSNNNSSSPRPPKGSNSSRSSNSGLDVFLLKILRNIALYTYSRQRVTMDSSRGDRKNAATTSGVIEEKEKDKDRGLWSPHVKTLVELVATMTTNTSTSNNSASNENNQDAVLELLGILGCLTVRDLPTSNSWARLLRDQGLLASLSRLMVPGIAQPDVLLEAVLVLSSATAEPLVCEVISSSSALGLVYQLFRDKLKASSSTVGDKGTDAELPLQLLYLFYRLLLNESSREELMYSTRIVADVFDCMTHRNSAIRRIAALTADLLVEFERQSATATNSDTHTTTADGSSNGSSDIAQQLVKARFEAFNAQWLQWAASAPESCAPSPVRRPLNNNNNNNNNGVLGRTGGGGSNYHFAEELDNYDDEHDINNNNADNSGIGQEELEESGEDDWRRLVQSNNKRWVSR